MNTAGLFFAKISSPSISHSQPIKGPVTVENDRPVAHCESVGLPAILKRILAITP
jgi:hypothetical protein